MWWPCHLALPLHEDCEVGGNKVKMKKLKWLGERENNNISSSSLFSVIHKLGERDIEQGESSIFFKKKRKKEREGYGNVIYQIMLNGHWNYIVTTQAWDNFHTSITYTYHDDRDTFQIQTCEQLHIWPILLVYTGVNLFWPWILLVE